LDNINSNELVITLWDFVDTSAASYVHPNSKVSQDTPDHGILDDDFF